MLYPWAEMGGECFGEVRFVGLGVISRNTVG